MEKTLRILNGMVEDGIIAQYAIGGAVAAIFYIEPLTTNDLDIFFHVPDASGLDLLEPIYSYLKGLGYTPEGDAIEIEGWPVQFLPAFNALLEEALKEANEVMFQATKTRVLKAEHLMAIMLQTGRHKDMARLEQFVETEMFDEAALIEILTRYDLIHKWSELREGL